MDSSQLKKHFEERMQKSLILFNALLEDQEFYEAIQNARKIENLVLSIAILEREGTLDVEYIIKENPPNNFGDKSVITNLLNKKITPDVLHQKNISKLFNEKDGKKVKLYLSFLIKDFLPKPEKELTKSNVQTLKPEVEEQYEE